MLYHHRHHHGYIVGVMTTRRTVTSLRPAIALVTKTPHVRFTTTNSTNSTSGVAAAAAVVEEENVRRTRGDTLPLRSNAKMWGELVKFRLSALVVASSGAGYLLAGPPYSVSQLVGVTIGTSLAAASASTFNQIYERNTDAMMKRTAHRPLPSGKITLNAARTTAVGLGVASMGVLGALTNPLTTALGVLNIGLYAGIYTPMKQMTIWNTWVGSLVGAIPPMMGYAGATGTVSTAPPLLLGASLFFWQFPHFFSLAWLLRKDYARGGHKMLVIGDINGVATGGVMMRHAMANSLVPFVAYGMNVTTIMFPIESLVFNAVMLWSCRKFQQDAKDEHARRLFRVSLVYLPVMMASFVFHAKEDRRKEDADARIVWGHDTTTMLDRARAWAREWCPHEWTVIRNRLEVNVSLSSPSSPSPPTPVFPSDHEGVCPSTSLRTSKEIISSIMPGRR